MRTRLNNLAPHIQEPGFKYDIELGNINKEITVAQQSGDEQQANRLWAIKSVVKIHKIFVEIFNLLKDADYYNTWCKAEEVEICCNNLRRNFPYVTATDSIYNTITNLQALYPYKLFSSYEIIIKKERCSICNQVRSLRNDCGHRRGYVYNGKFCRNIVEECALKGIAVVDNPVHKYAVLFPTIDDNRQQDNYDYFLVESLMKYWQRPFQKWSYNIVHTHKPITDFPKLTKNDYCPCASGKKYSECCKLDPKGIKHKIYKFLVEK